MAQTHVEVEPNSNRADANVILNLQPGQTIGGATTGTSTTTAALNSSDYFRIQIGTAPLAIYEQRLTATSTGSQDYDVYIRGYSQSNMGVIDTNSDAAVLSNTTGAQPRYVQWYGFGKGEFINYRISGATATTSDYLIEFTRTQVIPQTTSSTFSAGPITISSINQGTNTDFWVYDSNLDPVPTFGNDDNTVLGGGPGTGSTSIATRNLAPGTYYVAISTFNLANDQPSPFDERSSTLKNVMSDPDAVANSASSTGTNISFEISDGSTTEVVAATKPNPWGVAWVQFTVGAATNIQVTPAMSPDPVVPGTTALVTLDVTPAPMPPNTITSATVDLSPLGGSSSATLFDNGTNGDVTPGDGIYSLAFTVPVVAPPGSRALEYSVSDNGGRTTSGSFPINVAPIVPPNDDCNTATVLTDGDLPYSASIGINQANPDTPIGCSTSLQANNGIWYVYQPAANCVLTINETGSRDVAYSVYQGSCGSFELYCDTAEEATFPLQGGQTYYILIATPGSASTGANDVFTFTIACGATPPAPANDDCANAAPLTPSQTPVTIMSAGAGHDLPTTCITGVGVAEARNGVWYTYTTGPSDVLARLYRTANSPTVTSVAIYEGGCVVNEYACINLGTAMPGTGIPLRRNTTYTFLVHRRSGYMPADGVYEFVFDVENYPNVNNAECANATVVPALAFNDTVQNILAFDDVPLNDCPTSTVGDGSGGSGVWYVFTPNVPTVLLVEESSPQDAAIAVFEGSCFGPRVMCSLTDTDTSGSNLVRAQAGVPYYILVARQATGLPGVADQLSVSISGVEIPGGAPANDVCNSATVINSVPFNAALSNAFAGDDTVTTAMGTGKPVCARGTITNTARNGVWFRYTNGPAPAAAIMSETTGQDAMIAAYKGTCDLLVPVMCTDDPESNNYLYMEPNTTYYILVAHAFDFPSQGTETIDFNFDLLTPAIPPPANDDCANATRLKQLPFNTTDLPLAARHDADPSCSGNAVHQATNGVWYQIDGGATGFTLTVTETVSSPNVMYTLYDSCGGFEIACQTTDTNRTFPLFGGQTYYLLVSRESNSDYVLGATPPNLTISAAAGTSGACCNGTSCIASTIDSCTTGFVPGAICDPLNPVACCPANVNGVGGVTVQDIFDFLAAYFSQGPAADFNMSGTVTVQDIFDFLAAYFTGCT